MNIRSQEKLAVLAVLAGIVFLGWMWLAPRWTTKRASLSIQQSQAASAALLVGRYREAITEDIGAPDATEKLRAALGANLRDPGGALTAEQRRLLTEAIARHTLARSEVSPEAYLSMIESEPGTRWIAPAEDKNWERADDWFKYHEGAAASRDDPRSALARIIKEAHGPNKERIVQYGVGKRGLVLEISPKRVRSVDQKEDWFLRSEAELTYWFGPSGMSAMRFRVPVRPLERVIEEEGGAVVAACMMAVANEGGVTYGWYTIWYWDAESGSWQCDSMNRRGTPGMMYF